MKTDNNILEKLQSQKQELVIETIEQLGESGNSAYLPHLFELLHTTTDAEIKKHITRLLAELKHKDVVPYFIEAIKNKNYKEELQFLVSACWENGLDYSEHLPLFIDMLIEEDFMVAFEAHTVITNMEGKITTAMRDQETAKINHAITTATDEKKSMLLDVIDYLIALEEGIEPQNY